MSKTNFTSIIQNPHFQALCVPIRVALWSESWRSNHAAFNFWGAWERMEKMTVDYATSPDYVQALTKMLDGIGKVSPQLRIQAEDLAGYLALIDAHGAVVPSMFLAYASAKDSFVTPAQAAQYSGEAESTWRNRAANGDVPAAIKAGKQWLLPVGVLKVVFGLDVPRKESQPDLADTVLAAEQGDESSMTADDYQEVMRQLNKGAE